MRKKGIKIVVQKIENKRTQWSALEHKEGEPNQAERKVVSRLRWWRLGLFATSLYTDGTHAKRPGGFSGPPTGAGWALKPHISARGKTDSWRTSNSSLSHKQCSHWQESAEVRIGLPPHGRPAALTPGPYSPTYVQRHHSIKACSVMELARWHVPSWKFYWTSIQAIMLHFKKHIFLFFPKKTKYELFSPNSFCEAYIAPIAKSDKTHAGKGIQRQFQSRTAKLKQRK